MDAFRYATAPQEIRFAAGVLAQLPQIAADRGWERIALVTIGTFARSGTADRVAGLLETTLVARFDHASPHVPRAEVEAVDVLAKTHQVDALLALGGGSAIGLAKAVSHAGGCRLPIVAVPTTYAGSEMTPIFGVTETGPGGPRKVTARDRRLTPAVVIYDPDLTRTLPPTVAAASGVNALAHAVEALYSRTRQPLSSAAALHGAALIWRHLPCVVKEGAVDAYAPLLQGAHLTAVGLADVALGLHHGLCHVLGGAAGVGHGPANAIMLPHALRFNLAQTAPQLEPLAAALGIPTVDALPEAVETWIAGLGLPRRLREVGVPEADLPRLAALALQSKAVQTNPIPIDNPAQAEAVFRAAW